MVRTNLHAGHNRASDREGTASSPRPRSKAHPAHRSSVELRSCLCLLALLLSLLTGCGLFRFLSHDPTEDIKGAATDLSSEVKGSAREAEARLRESGEKFRDEIRTAAEGVSKIAKSADDLVLVAKDSPVAFGNAVAQQMLGDEAVRTTLKSLTGLARSADQVVAQAEKGPVLLAAKLGEMQTELTKADGFLTQQRDAILGELRKERAALTEAVARERAAVMKDLEAYSIKVVQEASAQARAAIGSALILLILLVLVLWGLPFAAGFLVGRAGRRRP